MHILIVHQAFAALDEAGGTRHVEMARYLVARGHQVTIISSPVSYLTGKSRQQKTAWVDRSTPEPGITILRTYTYAALHKSFVHRVFSFLSFMFSSFLVGLGVRHVDLVWGTSPPIFQGATAWLLAGLKGVPFLFEIRDLWPAFAIAVGVLKNPLLIRLSLWLEKFLYRRADRVMVNSPGYVQHVTQRGARWVELVPNGVDPEMFPAAAGPNPFRQANHLDGRFVVLYAGAHGLSNDLEIVLQSADLLRDQPHILFALVGDGKEKAALQTYAREHQLSNVAFFPPVPKTEMASVLAAADACLAILKPSNCTKPPTPTRSLIISPRASPWCWPLTAKSAKWWIRPAQASLPSPATPRPWPRPSAPWPPTPRPPSAWARPAAPTSPPTSTAPRFPTSWLSY
mgnify:CR=1 FL=1